MSTRLNSMHTAELAYPGSKPALLDRLARRIVFAQLEKLQVGQIIVSQAGFASHLRQADR